MCTVQKGSGMEPRQRDQHMQRQGESKRLGTWGKLHAVRNSYSACGMRVSGERRQGHLMKSTACEKRVEGFNQKGDINTAGF